MSRQRFRPVSLYVAIFLTDRALASHAPCTGKLLSDDSVTLAELDIFGETCIMCVSNPKPQAAGAPSTGAPAKADQPEPKEVTEDPEPDANPAPANGERVPADDNGGGGGGAAKNGVPAPANEDDVESKNDSGADEEEMVTLSLKTLRGKVLVPEDLCPNQPI